MMELMTNNFTNYMAGLSHYSSGKRMLGGECIVSVTDKGENKIEMLVPL